MGKEHKDLGEFERAVETLKRITGCKGDIATLIIKTAKILQRYESKNVR